MNDPAEVASYFARFGFSEPQIPTPPHPELRLVVVIPCADEPDLNSALASLWNCERPACAVEVLIVINSAKGCPAEVRQQNDRTWHTAGEWIRQHADPRLRFHLLHFPELPPKQAGVGLARKIGMDEALRRLAAVGPLREGIVAGYDADCGCDRNYLVSLERHFRQNPDSPGCSIYFEHPLTGPLDPRVYEAAAVYELHLRYYVRALRHAGFPYAFHTIGSCMAVRAEVYRQQGGMNRRQAGEDFYFLQKIIPLGGFSELTATRVLPSPRASNRVPFGTGKAVSAHSSGASIRTYPLEAFLDLRRLLAAVPTWRTGGDPGSGPVARSSCCAWRSGSSALPEPVQTFLGKRNFPAALTEIFENTSSPAAFQKRFFQWFNTFAALKFLHHARNRYYGDRPVAAEAARLLELTGALRAGAIPTLLELLEIYRKLDRRGCSSA